MPDIVNLFPLSVYRSPMTLDPQARERMIEAVLEMGRTELLKSEGISWTGDVNGFGFLHQDPRFGDAFAGFSEHLMAYFDFLKVDLEKLHLYYTRSWATISQGREQIESHRHRHSHISLVYYLKKPENSGGISFANPEAPNQFAPNIFGVEMLKHGIIKELDACNARTVTLEPRDGDVMIFPSMARHATQPNLSGEPRLSIAVDIVATVRDGDRLESLLSDVDKWTSVS